MFLRNCFFPFCSGMHWVIDSVQYCSTDMKTLNRGMLKQDELENLTSSKADAYRWSFALLVCCQTAGERRTSHWRTKLTDWFILSDWVMMKCNGLIWNGMWQCSYMSGWTVLVLHVLERILPCKCPTDAYINVFWPKAFALLNENAATPLLSGHVCACVFVCVWVWKQEGESVTGSSRSRDSLIILGCIC